MDDSELRTALKDDHEACFGWAVICCRGDRELAEDVLQSVYVSVLERRAVFRGESGFRTWLFGVIRNVARDTRRGRWWSRMVRLDFESIQATRAKTEQNEVDEQDQNLVVRRALEQLPVRQREIIHLVFL